MQIAQYLIMLFIDSFMNYELYKPKERTNFVDSLYNPSISHIQQVSLCQNYIV